jgi:hypothetical protein
MAGAGHPVRRDVGVWRFISSLQIFRDRGELFQGGLQVGGDVGSNDVRGGEIRGIFQRFIFQPETPRIHFPPQRLAISRLQQKNSSCAAIRDFVAIRYLLAIGRAVWFHWPVINARDLLNLFFAYLGNRAKMDPLTRLRSVRYIESALDGRMAQLLFEAWSGERQARQCYRKWGERSTVEFFEIWIRTLIANDKLMFYHLGLLKVRRNGDLRTAELVQEEREQLFALIALRAGRQHPGIKDQVQAEAQKMDPAFFSRMGAALKRPALEFRHVVGTKFQSFLLVAWAGDVRDSNGTNFPPLCYYSDPAIANLFSILAKGQPQVTSAAVRKTWERLGLRKSATIQFWTVIKKGRKIVISEFRRAENQARPRQEQRP